MEASLTSVASEVWYRSSEWDGRFSSQGN